MYVIRFFTSVHVIPLLMRQVLVPRLVSYDSIYLSTLDGTALYLAQLLEVCRGKRAGSRYLRILPAGAT